MDKAKRLPLGRAIIFFILASILLVACGTQTANTNWPGMSTDSQGVVYVAYGPGVAAVDTETSQQLWSYPPGGGGPTVQFYAAPSVEDGQVVFGDYGATGGILSPNVKVSVYSLDAADGALNPNWPISEIAQDRVVAPALQVGDHIFVGTADNFVFALDATTAQPVWSEPFEAEHSIWGQPAYQDGILFVSSLDRSVYALDAETGAMLWQTDVGGSVSDKPVNNSELVYAGSFDNQVYALDAQSGDIHWTATAEASVWGAPLHADDKVFFADLDGNVVAVDSLDGDIVWQNGGAGYVVAQPVFADGIVYIASAGEQSVAPDERSGVLIAFDAETGDELWRATTRAPLFTTPVVVEDTIVVAQEDPQALLVYFDLESGAQTGSFAPPATES
ncbi:MAG: PQQ-like beta-propeller repeat protein [Chloroflexota bacterium]|nr:MAG: PQQ-like beta-propeller repeat protein [Chloroflexota bacterium]